MRKFFINKQTKMRKSISFMLSFLLLFCTTATFAQQGINVTGTVRDAYGTLPGVSILIKGTSNGAVTDVDGKYQITVPNSNAVLQFFYVGYNTTEMQVGNQRVIDMTMVEDSQLLEEVVVVGYGVQKKALVTGSTINVGGGDIQKMSTSNPLSALQSMSPGVTIIQNSGQPGSDYIVNIRGIGTNGESRPLYVVDGVAVGFNGLNDMSTADIESIDILKDAASAAIYGARAANGVVLITTKQGKAGKTTVTYDAYYGKQYMSKMPDMNNAQEYMMLYNEIWFNMGSEQRDFKSLLPNGWYDKIMSGEWEGTNWAKEYYTAGAPTQEHSISITGGNDVSKFSSGYSISDAYGIFGATAQLHRTRHTMRLNSDHVILKGNGFDAIKIGQNLNFSATNSKGGVSRFSSIINSSPLMPVYDNWVSEEIGRATNSMYPYYGTEARIRDGYKYEENISNPIGNNAFSSSRYNQTRDYNLNLSVFLEIQPIKGLIFRTLYSYRYDASQYRNHSPISYFGTEASRWESATMRNNMGFQWTFTNTLNYAFKLSNHNFQAMVGQELLRSGYGFTTSIGANRNQFTGLGWDYAWVTNMNPVTIDDLSWSGSPRRQNAMSSFFGRVSWDLKETYMASLIFRADGSSNFAPGNRWGYFPSISAGWVISNEPFMESTKSFMNYLRLRGSFGTNGNAQISPYQYLSTFNYPSSGAADYYFGTNKRVKTIGSVPGVLKNPDVKWETTQSVDIAFDARFLRNRLNVGLGYFVKDTKDWLLQAPISATWGYDAPSVNGGDIRNQGVELSVGWNGRSGDFSYNISANGSYTKNRVMKINNPEGIIEGPVGTLSTNTLPITRLQEGYPAGYFLGWKHDGLFQNWDEVYSYVNKDGNLIQPSAQPGDIRFRDVKEDGIIDDLDRVSHGSGWPEFQAGLRISMDYKGFDLMIAGNGQFKKTIAKAYAGFVNNNQFNRATEELGRWTGEGTSNFWPRLTTGQHTNYYQISDLRFHKADYFRIQNVTLGYNVKRVVPQLPFSRCRVYITAQNLFTFTTYNGMDPECGYGPESWITGVDLGNFPLARTYLFGVQLTF